MFQEVPARPDYVAQEAAVLQLWERTRAFDKLREQTRGGPKWSFLDGPITANGPMGVHHTWGRSYKDLYNRYHAMLGHELRWQQGFDCQGLWVEVQVEKELGFADKRQIEQYGVASFVERCKERVFHFADLITAQSKRLGYWMDWESSYFTLSDENNYGIWGFLKECHRRGWLYRGHDVMPWCPRCGTALSEHEIATEGYVEKTHLAVTVALPLPDRHGQALLAWTTTPWTLPANVAAAVNPELVYVRVEPANDRCEEAANQQSYWLAEAALARLGLRSWRVAERRPGAELVGWRYAGPFDALPAQAGLEHRVLPWREVSPDEGSGVVHLAPGAGREDYALGREHGLAVLAVLDDDGVYVDGYGWLTGRKAGAVAQGVSAWLAERGLLFAQEQYAHRYPVCWRCGTDLVFRLVDEWLISMGELRAPMMEAARQASWHPAFGLERELDWLRNMDDWMISKKRFWGLALPIYPCAACGHVTVVGSREELRARALSGWDAFAGHSPHRPWVDAVLVACARCGAACRRVPDVGNPWLDAGLVAFSTLRYGSDRDYWQQWFPADLVVESFPGQFRNWFYALLAMSTTLTGQAPFRTLLGYATVKDANGAEMHKSKGNAIPFETAASWMGVDPLRWLFAGAAPERNIHFGRALVEEAARRLQPLWEVYRFFVTYANLEAENLGLGRHLAWQRFAQAGEPTPPAALDRSSPAPQTAPEEAVHLTLLDQWLLARLNQLVAQSRVALDGYDARRFTVGVEAFLDDLSNWYVRRSRRRFWGTARGNDAERRAAYQTLHTALVTLARLLAPALPFLSETLYQNLVRSVDPGAPESVHLTGYPVARQAAPEAEQLLDDMALVRRVVGLGRVARKGADLRVRQPLARMLVVAGSGAARAALRRLGHEALDELNVKRLELLDRADQLSQIQVKPNLRLLGPRLGAALPRLQAALAGLDQPAAAHIAGLVAAGQPATLELGEATFTLAPNDLLVATAPLPGYAVAQDDGLQVALDTALDEVLRREGLARDLVRAVQDARRRAGLALTDRIALCLAPADSLAQVLAEWGEFLRAETLSAALLLAPPAPASYTETVTFDGVAVTLGLSVIDG